MFTWAGLHAVGGFYLFCQGVPQRLKYLVTSFENEEIFLKCGKIK